MHRYIVTVQEPHPVIGLCVQWDINVDTENEDRDEAFARARKRMRRMAPTAVPVLATYKERLGRGE